MPKMPFPNNFRFYKVDGVQMPSVTTILGEFGEENESFKKFARENAEFLQFKANIGTVVHNRIAKYFIDNYKLKGKEIKGEPMKIDFEITDDMEIEIGSAMSYFDDFIKKYKVEPIEIEKQIWHRKMKYAGTADFLGYVNNILAVVDWKTSSSIYPDYPSQVTAYKQAILSEPDFKSEIKMCALVMVNARKGLTVGRVVDESKAWDGFLKPFNKFQAIYRLPYEQINIDEVRICQNTTGEKSSE